MALDSIDAAVLRALHPTGWGARLKERLAGGQTTMQIWGRLALATQESLHAEGRSTSAGHAGVEALALRLSGLAERGHVGRKRTEAEALVRDKGRRRVLVDVWHPIG